MGPRIENQLKKEIIGFDASKGVKKLIRAVPKEHLIGLDKITIVDRIKEKKKKGAGGIYRRKDNGQLCSIELALDTIYEGMPKILFLLPFVANFMLANVLYHEIGHHYHKKLTHGIKKKSEESFAEKYRLEMVKKRFRWWAPFFIPLAPLIKFLNKKVNKK